MTCEPENMPSDHVPSEYMVVAMQLVLYGVLTKLSEIDERFAAAVREGFEEAELGVKILAVRGPGAERRAEGAMLSEIIGQMKAQMFETELH